MLRRIGLAFFLLFVLSSTFSISLSQLSFGICLVLTIAAAFRERFNPFAGGLRWFWISVGVYVGWLIVICLLQDEPLRSLDHIREEWLFGIVPVGIYWMRDRRNLDHVLTALAAGMILISAASLVMLAVGMEYSWGIGFTEVGERPTPFQGNFAHTLSFGNYMAVAAIPLLGYGLLVKSCSRGVSTLALAGGGIGIISVLLTGSRGPILAVSIGLLVLVILSARRLRWVGAAGLMVVLAAAVLSPVLRDRFGPGLVGELDADNPRSRTFIWRTSLRVIADQPLLGTGPGNFASAYASHLPADMPYIRRYTHAHNDFLQAAARSGIPGLLLYGLIWAQVLRRLWKGRGEATKGSRERGLLAAALAGSLVFLVASLTEATFADEEVRAVLMLVWAVGFSVGYKSGSGSGRNEIEPIT